MKTLAIIGGGELGQQIAHLATTDGHYGNVGFFDDFTNENEIAGFEVFGKISDVERTFDNKKFDELIIGVGYKHMELRKIIYERFDGQIPFGNLIHSSCLVDKTVKKGRGIILYPGCILDKGVKLGNNVLLNIGSLVSHDSFIGSHSFLAPRVALAGIVEIGKQCILGINSTVIDNVVISDRIQLGGGTVVIKNLKKSGLYVGNPARFIRE